MAENILIQGPITFEFILSVLRPSGLKTDTGGHSIFLGQVRADIIENKKVIAIDYSAYESMVRSEADKIKASLFSEYGDVKKIEILHSTGLVKAGEISLFVMVSAGHRQQATEACSKAIELIKEKLPVWKKEIFDDNSSQWRQNLPH
jgi:molybdopterin synthase catalytic subunit